MTSWQRRLRLGLLIFIVVLAVGLFVALRRPTPRAVARPMPKPVEPGTVVESASGRVLKAIGAREDLVVDYDRLSTYSDGHSRLQNVTFKVPQRGGRDFTVTAKEAEVRGDAPNVDVTLKGDVVLTSSDGMKLQTADASYASGEGLMRAPGAVSFSREKLTGTSVGMTYDKNRDVLSLLEQAVIHIAPDDKGENAADIEAGSASMARRDKYIRFERGMKVVRPAQVITADESVFYLTDDEKRIQLIELRGSSKVTGTGEGEGGLRGMNARDMNLTYGEDGRKIRHAFLNGNAAVDIAGQAGGGDRRLVGQVIDIGLSADGSVLTSLTARDAVQLDLAADKSTPARTIKSATLQSGGTETGGLTWATFNDNVEFRELPSKPDSQPRVARSALLELALKNGLASIESARFSGGVRFEERTMAAAAREAKYLIAAGTLALDGPDPKTGKPPQVVDERAVIEATKIEIGLDTQAIVANEAVKTEMKDAPANDPAAQKGRAGQPAAGKSSHMPGMLKEGQPVFATATHLDYNSSTSKAVYTGSAQLWQGETTIKADTISVDSDKGDLSASGSVVSKMILEQVNDSTKAKEQVHSVATAKDLLYEDAKRSASYTGNAHLTGPQGDLTSDRIEIFMAKSSSEIERLEGLTGVKIKLPDGRVGTGDHLTFFSADNRYDMQGKPVKIADPQACETTGNVLQFFKSTDRIFIDGQEVKRTETKGCGKAPGRRHD